jgi:hypothetical protein
MATVSSDRVIADVALRPQIRYKRCDNCGERLEEPNALLRSKKGNEVYCAACGEHVGEAEPEVPGVDRRTGQQVPWRHRDAAGEFVQEGWGMSIDLSKLSPAPWQARCLEPHTVQINGKPFVAPPHVARVYYDEHRRRVTEMLLDGKHAVDLEFAALARNAFAVQMETGWYAVRIDSGNDVGKWMLARTFWAYTNAFAAWCQEHVFADPLTAIVETRKWYVENIEKKG